MTLLYLTLAYLSGILLGRIGGDNSWFGCSFPNFLWWLPLALLPITPHLNRWLLLPRSHSPMRWPAWAGFEPPRPTLTPALLMALLLCVLTGALRYASHPLQPCWTPADLAYFNLPAARAFDKSAPEVTVTGYVSSYPLVADTKQQMQVVVKKLTDQHSEYAVVGELRLTTGIRQLYAYGQPVRLRGRLVTPPEFEDFSYRAYLARQGVHSLFYSDKIEGITTANQGNPVKRVLYALRARGEVLLNRLLPEPYAALANGMLLGIDAGIPDQLYEQFNLTGTSHIIVISGSNLAVISGLLLGLGQRLFGRKRAVGPTLVGLGCYACLVGGDPAVLRAALMGGLFVMALGLDRRSTALVSLAVACWAMTLLNPLTLWDVGFQLSSAATAGLILFTPGITALFLRVWPDHDPSQPLQEGTFMPTASLKTFIQALLQDGLLVTIAANLTTLPLVVYYFGRLSVVSLFANLAIVPVQSFIMLWGSIGILIGVLGLSWLAWLFMLVPWLSLVWTVAIVQWTATLPGASLDIAGYNLWGMTITYLVLFGIYWRDQLRERCQQGLRWIHKHGVTRVIGPSAVGVMSIGCILVWLGALSQPDGRLHVYFLDIGQGDGILIQTPSGHQVLIDGGASPQQLFNQLGAVMPFWQRRIDIVALTNPDKDHMAAQAQTPLRFQVTTGLSTVAGRANHDSDPWYKNIVSNSGEVQLHHVGGWFDLGDGVALWVLWPPIAPIQGASGKQEQLVDNENSLVMKLVYGDFSVLLTGDAGLPSEMALLAAGEPVGATVLKVGHHGSKGSTSQSFVQAVNPLVAVIQSGVNNSYGHPHAEVLDRLAGRLILRNDLQGRIHIYSDGHQMWLTTEKSPPLLGS